jgi:DNA invertase Pin-like site-specific DNA recombinase
MPSTNGYGTKRVILYARVSTDEQARRGYSLAQQLEALREYAAREGLQALEEVEDPGQSGATSLERPGMDRVRDLVATGGVSVVLAQDRDRFSREPAYHYLLKREFEEHGTRIRALNDRGDDTPEGDLTDGILDQLAKYEKAKIAERTRRGKLRKAREGKVIAGRAASYGRAAFGFKYNEKRDGLILDEERILIVKRMFYMAGVEGSPIYAIKRALDADGVPTPTGKASGWAPQLIRRYLLSDLYKPHTFEEIRELVSPEVAVTLDPEKRYGVWWWGRSRLNRRQVAESGPDGRCHRYRYTTAQKPKEGWIAVPVPGIPCGWVDAARERVNNRKPSNAGRREWELSGGILRCAECGRAMTAHTPAPSRSGTASTSTTAAAPVLTSREEEGPSVKP